MGFSLRTGNKLNIIECITRAHTFDSFSAFSLALLSILEVPGGCAFSLVCFSFSIINEAVGAKVKGLGRALSSSETVKIESNYQQ